MATNGRTVEQLFMPKKIIAQNIEPNILKMSCWLSLQNKNKNHMVNDSSLNKRLPAPAIIDMQGFSLDMNSILKIPFLII